MSNSTLSGASYSSEKPFGIIPLADHPITGLKPRLRQVWAAMTLHGYTAASGLKNSRATCGQIADCLGVSLITAKRLRSELIQSLGIIREPGYGFVLGLSPRGNYQKVPVDHPVWKLSGNAFVLWAVLEGYGACDGLSDIKRDRDKLGRRGNLTHEQVKDGLSELTGAGLITRFQPVVDHRKRVAVTALKEAGHSGHSAEEGIKSADREGIKSADRLLGQKGIKLAAPVLKEDLNPKREEEKRGRVRGTLAPPLEFFDLSGEEDQSPGEEVSDKPGESITNGPRIDSGDRGGMNQRPEPGESTEGEIGAIPGYALSEIGKIILSPADRGMLMARVMRMKVMPDHQWWKALREKADRAANPIASALWAIKVLAKHPENPGAVFTQGSAGNRFTEKARPPENGSGRTIEEVRQERQIDWNPPAPEVTRAACSPAPEANRDKTDLPHNPNNERNLPMEQKPFLKPAGPSENSTHQTNETVMARRYAIDRMNEERWARECAEEEAARASAPVVSPAMNSNREPNKVVSNDQPGPKIERALSRMPVRQDDALLFSNALNALILSIYRQAGSIERAREIAIGRLSEHNPAGYAAWKASRRGGVNLDRKAV